MQAHHVEAMQQVAAETAVGHPCLEVLVGGGDHAHVDPDQLAPANAEELVLGQHPQQPGLQRRRHVADLVEEQGAAVGLLETRSEEHTSELQSLMRISYAVFCLKQKKTKQQ